MGEMGDGWMVRYEGLNDEPGEIIGGPDDWFMKMRPLPGELLTANLRLPLWKILIKPIIRARQEDEAASQAKGDNPDEPEEGWHSRHRSAKSL